MELNEEGVPIIPEDLENKPRDQWTFEDFERSGGSGRAVEGPEMLGAALSITPAGRAVSGAIGTVEKGIDIGKKVWQSPQMKGVRTSDFIQNLGSGGNASKMQKTVKPIEQVGNAIDEVLAIPSRQLNQITRLNKNAGFKTKDLADNLSTIQDILNESSINFEDKGGFLDVNNWTIPEGYKPPRQSTISKVGGNHWKRLQEVDKLRITEVITNLEDYHIGKLEQYDNQAAGTWNPQKPTRGFKGNRIVKTSSGLELGIGWNNANQSYFLFDYQKNQNALKGRYRADKSGTDPWSQLTSKSRRSSIKIKNREALEALNRIKTDNPDLYFDIVGSMEDPKNVWTAEHINARTSGVWEKQSDGRLIHKFRKKSDGSDLYFGDSENIMPATGNNYGDLKTSIENHLVSLPPTDIHSNLYVDIDPVTRNFLLRNRSNGRIAEISPGKPYARIHGMTPSNKWREVLENVLAGNQAVGLVDTNPAVPTDIALEEPGILGKESNTRLEPPSGNIIEPELTEDQKIQQNIQKKIESLPIGLRQRIEFIKEILEDHDSGVETISKDRYKKLSKEYNKAVLQLDMFNK